MGLKDEATLLAEEFVPDVQYVKSQNAKSLQDFKLQTKPTDFDNVLFKDVKLKQLPKFIWQNLGWTGLYRFDNAVHRTMGTFFHTSGARGLSWLWLTIGVVSVPNVINYYTKETRRVNVVIKEKFGESWEKMDNFEKTYYFRKMVRELNQPHFA